MSVIFKDSDHFYNVLLPFFDRIKADPVMWPKIKNSGLTVQFRYSDPDAVITIDCPKEEIIRGEIEGMTPVVVMSMKADTAHKFWLGKLSLMVALTKRDIIAKGPIASIMKLLPVIKDSFPMYNDYLREIGMESAIDFK